MMLHFFFVGVKKLMVLSKLRRSFKGKIVSYYRRSNFQISLLFYNSITRKFHKSLYTRPADFISAVIQFRKMKDDTRRALIRDRTSHTHVYIC